jgi:EAL domain-containing protein (putative c-di-GMP-specific phosphodiesterase class I)
VQSLGADTAQGYHLARPMDAQALSALLGLDPNLQPQVTGASSGA